LPQRCRAYEQYSAMRDETDLIKGGA